MGVCQQPSVWVEISFGTVVGMECCVKSAARRENSSPTKLDHGVSDIEAFLTFEKPVTQQPIPADLLAPSSKADDGRFCILCR